MSVLAGHSEHAEQDGDDSDDVGGTADHLHQTVGPERVVAILAGQVEDGEGDQPGHHGCGTDTGHRHTGGALLEQLGSDQLVHDGTPSLVVSEALVVGEAVLVSEKKTSSRFDSSSRIS